MDPAHNYMHWTVVAKDAFLSPLFSLRFLKWLCLCRNFQEFDIKARQIFFPPSNANSLRWFSQVIFWHVCVCVCDVKIHRKGFVSFRDKTFASPMTLSRDHLKRSSFSESMFSFKKNRESVLKRKKNATSSSLLYPLHRAQLHLPARVCVLMHFIALFKKKKIKVRRTATIKSRDRVTPSLIRGRLR